MPSIVLHNTEDSRWYCLDDTAAVVEVGRLALEATDAARLERIILSLDEQGSCLVSVRTGMEVVHVTVYLATSVCGLRRVGHTSVLSGDGLSDAVHGLLESAGLKDSCRVPEVLDISLADEPAKPLKLPQKPPPPPKLSIRFSRCSDGSIAKEVTSDAVQ